MYHSLLAPLCIRHCVVTKVSAGWCFAMERITLLGALRSTVRINSLLYIYKEAKAHSSSILPRRSVGIMIVMTPLSVSNAAAFDIRVEKGRAEAWRAMLRCWSGHEAPSSKQGGLHVMQSYLSWMGNTLKSAFCIKIANFIVQIYQLFFIIIGQHLFSAYFVIQLL